MTLKTKLLLAALAASLLVEPALAQSADAQQQKPAARRSHAKPSAKPVAAKSPDAPECPRGQYKGDPVCFGADDAAALPVPSSTSGAQNTAPKRTEDVTVSAKPRLNQPTESPTYFNNPNPRPSTNDVGGGVGVGFHF
ncbi:MAG: hypothetical protein WAK01_16175 [Methylocystis sp.]